MTPETPREAGREALEDVDVSVWPHHLLVIDGDYGVTCRCGAVLAWPDAWARTEAAAHRLVAFHAAAPATGLPAAEGLRDWQRDLLAFDADGRTFDQVVADLLGVKSVNLRTEQDNEGNPTSEDRRWRVQYFGGTYGGTLDQCLAAADRAERGLPLDVERLARALEATLADAVMAGPGGIRELGDGRTSYWHDRAEAVAEKYADDERAGWYRGPEAEPFA